MSSESSSSGGGCGCISVILTVLALWALIFGVTINGHHYGISSCDCSNGVNIQGAK